jgi:hypothetical protein
VREMAPRRTSTLRQRSYVINGFAMVTDIQAHHWKSLGRHQHVTGGTVQWRHDV